MTIVMPIDTNKAVTWAFQQKIVTARGEEFPITKDNCNAVVDKVREYFNTNNITYSTFSYDDLSPFFN